MCNVVQAWQQKGFVSRLQAYGTAKGRNVGPPGRNRPPAGLEERPMNVQPSMPATDDVFTVDVPLKEDWLLAALETVRRGEIARVSVVIKGAGRSCTYGVRVLGGGDVEYMYAAVAGDFTKELAWRGE